MAVAFIAAYISYNEIIAHIRGKYVLSYTLREEIKGTFPWTVLTFTALYIINSAGPGRKKGYLTIQQYITIFVSQIIISNLVFLPKGVHVIVVLNCSYLYLAIFLLAWNKISVHKPSFTTENLSQPLFIAFMGLLAACAFLLISGQEKSAEMLANIAYCTLAVAAGIEIFQLFKRG